MRVKFPGIFAIAALACKAFTAELRVEDKDLPRVPATEPDKAAATFQMRDGFRAELVANEPLVADPVAVAFDENGRLFVVEMRDYSERRDEKLGRVKLLEDADGDGRFDKATLYATNLPWPTAVICWKGGVFIGASPDIIYFKDTNNDGVADERRAVFTGFGNAAEKLNVQALLNSFTWGIDNRIHGALGGNAGVVTNLMRRDLKPLQLRGRDFSFDPHTFDLRPESGGGQWGMSFDDEGNKFLCSNSRHIAVEMYEDRYAARNRFYALPSPDANIAVDGPAAEVFRISPDEPWRVIRTKWRVSGLVPGPVEGGGRPSGYFTGAAGVTIYRGDAFPEEYRGNAFIADCGSNLIHRKRIRRDGLNFIAERAADEQNREFLASRDNWFRPVAFANAPDGTLYVVDMYRETVEHPWSIPPELKSKLDLDSGNDRGRIYRIVPNDFKQPKRVRLGDATTVELVKALEHPSGWHRDTAARLLSERRDTNAVALLREAARGAGSAVGRIHALHTLRSLDATSSDGLVKASRDSNAVVRIHAIHGAVNLARRTTNFIEGRKLLSALQPLANDPDVRVRYQLALVESNSVTLAQIIKQDVERAWMRAAVLNGLSGVDAADVFAALVGDKEFGARSGAMEFLRELARIAGASAPWNRLALGLRVSGATSNALGFASAMAGGLEQRGTALAAVDRKSFDRLNDLARTIVQEPAQPQARRIEAVEFLGRSGDSQAPGTLTALLAAYVPAPLQLAAATALTRGGSRSITNVFAHWSELAPQVRAKVASAAVSRWDTAKVLLQAVEQGTVGRTELPAADVQRLLTHNDAELRKKARDIFQKDESARSEVVKRFQPALELKGDAGRGQPTYQQRCASCHRAGAEGFAVGPDLASVATSGKEKLLTSILDPNAEVAAAYVAYSAETKRGESFVGVLAGENPLAVILKMANGETTRLGRENIVALRASDKSLMPEGLEEGLSVQELADLLEFVMQAKPAP